jgi:hypothetical protein
VADFEKCVFGKGLKRRSWRKKGVMPTFFDFDQDGRFAIEIHFLAVPDRAFVAHRDSKASLILGRQVSVSSPACFEENEFAVAFIADQVKVNYFDGRE